MNGNTHYLLLGYKLYGKYFVFFLSAISFAYRCSIFVMIKLRIRHIAAL